MTNILFIMDPISTVNPKKDSTLAMIVAAQNKNWRVFYAEQKDMFVSDGAPFASIQELTINLAEENWYQLSEPNIQSLGDLNVIMMRKDPPFDNEYIYSTYILELAENQGALIVNKPQSLRDANEKLFSSSKSNQIKEIKFLMPKEE